MEKVLTNLKIFDRNNKDVTNRMKFIKGWLVSIASLNLLCKLLNLELHSTTMFYSLID